MRFHVGRIGFTLVRTTCKGAAGQQGRCSVAVRGRAAPVMYTLEEGERLLGELEELDRLCEPLAWCPGMSRLRRGLRSELTGLQQSLEVARSAGQDADRFRELTARICGSRNNAMGIRAELRVASNVPGLTAVGLKVPGAPDCSGTGRVDIDVVCHGGACWIEVKSVAELGPSSSAWQGNPGHVKGLRVQLQAAMHAAQMERNFVRYAPPRVVLVVAESLPGDLREEIEAMGVHVAVGFSPALPTGAPGELDTCVRDEYALRAVLRAFARGHRPAERAGVGGGQRPPRAMRQAGGGRAHAGAARGGDGWSALAVRAVVRRSLRALAGGVRGCKGETAVARNLPAARGGDRR